MHAPGKAELSPGNGNTCKRWLQKHTASLGAEGKSHLTRQSVSSEAARITRRALGWQQRYIPSTETGSSGSHQFWLRGQLTLPLNILFLIQINIGLTKTQNRYLWKLLPVNAKTNGLHGKSVLPMDGYKETRHLKYMFLHLLKLGCNMDRDMHSNLANASLVN